MLGAAGGGGGTGVGAGAGVLVGAAAGVKVGAACGIGLLSPLVTSSPQPNTEPSTMSPASTMFEPTVTLTRWPVSPAFEAMTVYRPGARPEMVKSPVVVDLAPPEDGPPVTATLAFATGTCCPFVHWKTKPTMPPKEVWAETAWAPAGMAIAATNSQPNRVLRTRRCMARQHTPSTSGAAKSQSGRGVCQTLWC